MGDGPGALSLMVCALRGGQLSTLAGRGLGVVGVKPQLGAGDLRAYDIPSDTRASTFLESLDGPLSGLLATPHAQALRACGEGAAPLPIASGFLDVLGRSVDEELERRGAMRRRETRAERIARREDGCWRIALRRRDGFAEEIAARNVILAVGATQVWRRLREEIVGHAPLSPRHDGKLVLSGDVLCKGGRAAVVDRLSGVAAPRIAIVGGSHSAVACAVELLSPRARLGIPDGGLAILHRKPLRVYYPSATAAWEEGYRDFGPADLCPKTKAVYRLAGFRLAARDFVAAQLKLGGRTPDRRAVLHDLSKAPLDATEAILADADLIIAALGYRPRTIPVFEPGGARVRLNADEPGAPALVDRQCRLIDADGKALPGLFGIGLSSGFVPYGTMGGEPSFIGQTNGIWLWQNDIGAVILRALCRESAVAYT